MNSFMMAFGLAGIMLCVGMVLRARLVFLRRMLVPASVIGGIIGMILMNILPMTNVDIGADSGMYTNIVNNLFTISFISISLTGSAQGHGASKKEIMRGAVGMGMVWCLLYALTPIIAAVIIGLAGKSVGMGSIYGFLIQFAFCQGPGQSAAYGAIFEQFGIENASMTAITFSTIGFIVAFLVGIPAAKAGITSGIAKHCGRLDEPVLRGYLKKTGTDGIYDKGHHLQQQYRDAVISFCIDRGMLCTGCGNFKNIITDTWIFGDFNGQHDVYEWNVCGLHC